ncbi:MAG: DUF1727 domain-containing protein [Clostridia bacterium]|nr:DUF1727 domain-containing protein [Clostridia bacterium]
MKRNLRFYFALLFARCTALALKLIGRKGTSMPGSWAIILCPDFIGRMPKPKTVIGITGTNGKTTVANLVEDVLTKNGIEYSCNRMGSNVNTGIASALINSSHFWGKPKHDLAIFEMDERSSPRLYPYIQPDILVCTNLFRDSCKRNAHAEYIFNILDKEIPKTTKLVLNADDPLSSSLCPENSRVYYSIEHLDSDKTACENIVNDFPLCPKCASPLHHDVVRYHHIGRVHCPNCDYASPVPDYLAQNVDIDAMTMMIEDKDGGHSYPLKNDSVINIYNVVTAVALLREMGLSPEQIRTGLDAIQISETRYSEVKTTNGKRIIHHLAKAQNPIACSRAFENVRNASGKKAILLLLDDRLDAAKTVELKAWLYDTDFEFLKDDSIEQLLLVGKRHYDTYMRALLAGIPAEKIVHMEDAQAATAQLDKKADTFFILYEMHSISLAQNIRELTLSSEWATETP